VGLWGEGRLIVRDASTLHPETRNYSFKVVSNCEGFRGKAKKLIDYKIRLQLGRSLGCGGWGRKPIWGTCDSDTSENDNDEICLL
jgi:hypothetical protein